MEEQDQKQRGRPFGSKNKARDEVEVFISACKSCGSTKRTRYTNTITHDLEGELPTGQRYNQVTWRNTTCRKCGQARVDRFYEMVETVEADQLNEVCNEQSEEILTPQHESNASDIFAGCIGGSHRDDLIHDSNGNPGEDQESSEHT